MLVNFKFEEDLLMKLKLVLYFEFFFFWVLVMFEYNFLDVRFWERDE